MRDDGRRRLLGVVSRRLPREEEPGAASDDGEPGSSAEGPLPFACDRCHEETEEDSAASEPDPRLERPAEPAGGSVEAA